MYQATNTLGRHISRSLAVSAFVILLLLANWTIRFARVDLAAEPSYRAMVKWGTDRPDTDQIDTVLANLSSVTELTSSDPGLFFSIAKAEATLASAYLRRRLVPEADATLRASLQQQAEVLNVRAHKNVQLALAQNPSNSHMWALDASLGYQTNSETSAIIAAMARAYHLGPHETEVLTPMIELGAIMWPSLDEQGRNLVKSMIETALIANRKTYNQKIMTILVRNRAVHLVCSIEALVHTYPFCQ